MPARSRKAIPSTHIYYSYTITVEIPMYDILITALMQMN